MRHNCLRLESIRRDMQQQLNPLPSSTSRLHRFRREQQGCIRWIQQSTPCTSKFATCDAIFYAHALVCVISTQRCIGTHCRNASLYNTKLKILLTIHVCTSGGLTLVRARRGKHLNNKSHIHMQVRTNRPMKWVGDIQKYIGRGEIYR